MRSTAHMMANCGAHSLARSSLPIAAHKPICYSYVRLHTSAQLPAAWLRRDNCCHGKPHCLRLKARGAWLMPTVFQACALESVANKHLLLRFQIRQSKHGLFMCVMDPRYKITLYIKYIRTEHFNGYN
jgi:hypothetical protein